MSELIAKYFKKSQFPKYQYGYRHVVSPLMCGKLLDKLRLKEKYTDSSKLDIIDVFSGYGLFSVMLNSELKPRNHIIIEDNKENVHAWKERIGYLEQTTGNRENFHLYAKNGYNWSTYNMLIKDDKIISPKVLDRKDPNDELLIVGNLTPSKFGEALLAQWIMCSAYRNWLQKYGRVRMICFVPEITAQKFLSGVHFHKRNRSAIKRELFTDSKLIGITENTQDSVLPDGNDYDPNLLVKDQPVIIPARSLLPANSSLAIIEILPKDIELMDFDMFEYALQTLMYRSTGKLSDALAQFAPGALAELGPQIPPSIMQKSPRDISSEEFLLIYNIIDRWAFKPSIVDTLSIMTEDSRD